MWVSIMLSPDGIDVPLGRVHGSPKKIHKYMKEQGNNYVVASESPDRIVYVGNDTIPGYKIVFVNIYADVLAKAKNPIE